MRSLQQQSSQTALLHVPLQTIKFHLHSTYISERGELSGIFHLVKTILQSNPLSQSETANPIVKMRLHHLSHQRSRSPVVENHGGHKKGLRFIPHELFNIFGFRKHRKLLQFCLWQGSFGAASGGSGDWRWWFHLCSGEERFCQGFKNITLSCQTLFSKLTKKIFLRNSYF